MRCGAGPREPGDHRRRTASTGGRKAGVRDPTTWGLMMVSMFWDVPQAAAYSRPLPSRSPRRRGGVDRNAPNSGASRQAVGRAVARRCRAATRRSAANRKCRPLLPAGVHGRSARRAAARQGRPRAGMSRPSGFGRYGCGRDGDRAQTACPAPAQGRRESKAAAPGRRAFGSGSTFLRARPCGRRDRPRPPAGKGDRRSIAPRALAGRSSARLLREMAARRPAALRSPACRDRPRKVRPQGDHLLARECCGRLMTGRAERRTAAKASAELRRAASPVDVQIARKSGLRRTHSQANPRAFNVSNAR